MWRDRQAGRQAAERTFWPSYFVGFHSRASRCASAICSDMLPSHRVGLPL
jgi:hypothetical protein